MTTEREKELQRLIYLKSEIIKQCKKEIKEAHKEIDEINRQKVLKRRKQKG